MDELWTYSRSHSIVEWGGHLVDAYSVVMVMWLVFRLEFKGMVLVFKLW
jgi:hypothetical protein